MQFSRAVAILSEAYLQSMSYSTEDVLKIKFKSRMHFFTCQGGGGVLHPVMVGGTHPVMVGGTPGTPHHPDLAGGGFSIQSWWGGYLGYPPLSRPGQGGGTPSSHGGVPRVPPHHPDLAGGVLHPVMVGGYPGYPPTIRPWMGYYPPSPTIQTWDGVPPQQTWGGVPPHHQTWDEVPPHHQTWDGVPPPQPMVNRQTFPSINITFPRTTYAGGKKVPKE